MSTSNRRGSSRSNAAARDSDTRAGEDGTVDEGVTVDGDATAKRQPVTVIVSPAGNHYDADTWSDANNLLSMGYSIADGYPTGPGDVPASGSAPAVESGAADPAAGAGSDSSGADAPAAGSGESSSAS